MSRRRTDPDRDASDLAGFGYRQTLIRSLGGFSAFAAGFSYLSILTGSSQLFHMGFAAGGPAFFWTWPAVLAGQSLVALCFAELAATYPLSGGVYQWSKQAGGASVGWMAGWVYLACAVVTLASVALALQATLPQLSPAFQLVGRAEDRADAARNAVLLGCTLVAASTAINAVGLRLLARVNNVGVAVEMVAAVALIGLLAWNARRGPGVVFDTAGRGAGSPFGYLGPALAASLMATFVLYGFDTAGSLAEETADPRRRAPRAILLALGSVGLAGSLLVFTALRATPDLSASELGRGDGGLAYVVRVTLGPALGTPFLVAMALSMVVCTLTVHAAAVRLVFAMARDDHLPFAASLAKVGAGSGSPALPAVVIGAAAVGLLLANRNDPNLIETLASTAVVWANLAYLFVTVPTLWRRVAANKPLPLFKKTLPLTEGEPEGVLCDPRSVAGQPPSVPPPRGGKEERLDAHGRRDEAPAPGLFRLGRWGPAVNAAAVVWGVLLVVNTGWPRPTVYGESVLGRTGALVPTVVMVALGVGYDCLIRRRRSGIVLDGHRAERDNDGDPGEAPARPVSVSAE